MRTTSYIFAIFIMAILALSFTGCGGHNSEAWKSMDMAESIIEERPDSSYQILQSIKTSSLKGDEEKARYALLMSMALDKNYIDTTTFDVLQPAIDYYLKKGTPDEKLRTYYYQGRIYQNNGENDKAMESFVKALDLKNEVKDTFAIARVHVAKGAILYSVYDYEGFIHDRLEAARLNELKSNRFQFNCLIAALDGALLDDKKELSDSILSVLKSMPNKSVKENHDLMSLELIYNINYRNDSVLDNILHDFISLGNSDLNDMMLIANSYQTMGACDSALMALKTVKESREPYDSLKYEGLMALTLQRKGRADEALQHYIKYTQLFSDQLTIKLNSKLQTSEQRHTIALQAMKESEKVKTAKWWFTTGLVALCFVLIIVILIVRNNNVKKEKFRLANENLKIENANLQLEGDKKVLELENYRHRIAILEDERDRLTEEISSSQSMPEDVKKEIRERVEMLNAILAEKITDNEKHLNAYSKWIKDLTADRQRFMNSTRLAFMASHPKFMKYLESHNLTVAEINYLCLYAIGLRGKEVGEYIQLKRHYHISSDIRSKLGIDEHETNIGIYVRKLLNQL